MKASWSGVIDCKGSVLLIEPAWQERRCVPAEFRGRRMRASKPDRREFLRNAALGGASAVFSIRRWAKEPSRRPNILFCIADDQSYRHAGAYGSTWLWTPGFDRIAGEGVLFRNGLVSTPSCCPSRGSILTGQGFYRLKEASMNHTVWPSGAGLPLYTDLLAGSGYRVGFTGKPWGPGNWKVSGRRTDPCSPAHNQVKLAPPNKRISSIDYAGNLGAFLAQLPRPSAQFRRWGACEQRTRLFSLAALRLAKIVTNRPARCQPGTVNANQFSWHFSLDN